ncbi:hypothetical protein PspLS_03518 [Pyricularia sp. CBS 133598]|nr:hypothetical protein PspLS_03518 [Pyricularia sp. CBS 133598]
MSNPSKDNTSTLQSVYDSVTGTAQSMLGSLTGSTGDQVQGDAKQNKAKTEHDASHATLKGPGFTASSAGVAKDDPDRMSGSMNQTIGSAKETLGGIVGSESLKAAGREQNRSGQEQEAKGQLSDLGAGVSDRVTGTLGAAAAGLMGDQTKQNEYQAQHDSGKTAQRGVEHDLQKKADAEAKAAQN